jgi:hypothetical protein
MIYGEEREIIDDEAVELEGEVLSTTQISEAIPE